MTYKYFINKLTIVAFILGLVVPTMSWGQTYYDMSSGNKTWDLSGTWTVSSATYSGTDAVNWASVAIIGTGTSVTTGTRTTKSSASIVTGVNGGFQKPTGTIQFLSTGSGTTPEAVAIDLLLNFSGRVAGNLTFDWAAIDNSSGTRPTSLRIFWSVDGSSYTELTAAQVLDKESGSTPSSGSITVALPTNFNGASTARLRFYNHAGTVTGSGNRDKMQIDNISVTSTAQPTPSAPTISNITPGNTQLSVAFTAPSSDGGSAITNYEYSTNGGTSFTACSPAQTTSPIVITGLTNGTPYNVQLRAVNANGSGTATSSTAATPYTTPSAPTMGTITPGNGQISVAFTAGSNGGSAITNYKYSTNGGTSFTACSPAQTTSPIVITGLTNGTSYDVQILAVNAAGDGTATSTTTATPYTTPSAPSITSVNPTNTTLTVNFTAGSNGGSAITDYKYSTNGGTSFTSAATATSPITISGLTLGTSYDVQIKAVNAAGDGVATASYTASTTGGCTPPATQPTWAASTNVKSTSATINFSRGNGTNVLVIARMGSAVSTSPSNATSYTANATFASGDAIGSGYVVYNGTGTSFTVTGLTYNTTYHFALYEYDNATNCNNTTNPAIGSITTATPSISLANVSSNPIDFGTLVYPATSAEDNYTVSGTNLVSALTITAPTNFELATDAAGPYNTTLSLNPDNEVVASTILYVRFNPSSANGTNTSNLSHTATGATTQTTGVTAVAIASQPTTASTITFGTQTTSSVVVNFSGGNGSKRILVVKSGSAVSFTPTDATTYAGVNAALSSATDQGSGNKIVYDGTGNTVTVTGLSSSTTYHFAVYEYNVGTSSSQNYYATSGINNVFILDNAVYTADNAGTDLTENFNTLANTGTSSTMPTGWYFSETGSGNNTTYTAGTGSSNSGDTYSFGTTAGDRALGTLLSGSVISTIGTKFINSSGENITSIKVSYTGEQWRLGATGRQDKLAFSYSTDATSLTTGTWTTLTALDFSSPITTGTTGALDGNLTANRTQVTSTITGLSIANGSAIWFRWVDTDAANADDALAIDDVTFTPFSNTTTASAPNPTPGTVNNLNINNDATLIGDVTVSGKLNIESGKKITLNGNKLIINGAVVGTPTIVSDGVSNIEIGGTGAIGTLNFDQTTPGTTNKIKDLTINRNGATVTVGNALQVANNGTITVTNGTLASGGNITLVSDISGTGRIAALGAGASITGNVTVQRYMVGGASSLRGWRTMSSPVTGASYAQLVDDIFVTGPGGTTNGFDANGSNSSVMYYEESASPGWRSIASINDTWPTGKGALVFFRGDRTQTTSLTSSSVAPNSFALDYIGSVNTGTVNVNLDYEVTSSDPGWNLVGNPYPSQIDWDLITKSGGVDNSYYVINPNTKNYVAQSNGQIAIGQGFFILVNSASQTLTFDESNKVGLAGTAYFKTTSNPMEVKMRLDSMQYDIASLKFKTNASLNYVFKEDAVKLQNPSYNLSFVTPNNRMVQHNVIDYLANTGVDTFTLRVTSTTNRAYTLEFANFVDVPSTKSILLLDKMNNTVTNLRVTPAYSFTINNGTANSYGDRFALIITDQSAPLPVNLLSFTGKATGKTNTITWTTTGEKNLISYEVQRSTDNKIFETVAVVKPNNSPASSIYRFVDEQLPTATSTAYYRLKVVEPKSNSISSVVTISRDKLSEQNISLYPNPTTDLINFTNAAQITSAKITDVNGNEVLKLNSTTDAVDVSSLSKGIYFVVITALDGTTTNTKLIKK